MKDITKKVGAIALGIGIAGAGLLGGATLFPKTITEEVIVENIVEVPYEVEVIKEVPVEVEVEKIIEVDNGNLQLVLDYIYDGNVELVVDGLEDDELDLIVDRIIFLNDAKALSENFVRNNFKSHLEDEEVEEDKDLITDVFLLNTNLKDVDFKSYEDFGYKSVKADVEVAYRYDGSGFKTITLEVEIWNDKVRFI